MVNIKEYIESGIIESYVTGTATEAEVQEVETYALQYSEVQEAIDKFSNELEQYALANAVEPDPLTKPLLFATIDFMTRMEGGEQASEPPILNEGSVVSEYRQWLEDPRFQLKDENEDIYARFIASNNIATTAIVWLKDLAPQEVHQNEYERFLVVEGSCEITIGEEVHSLTVGSYLQIPLHVTHSVKVTSSERCKVILQRVAA